eukprot:CAMPEP_0171296972 /NCGR_PEP_ID=MMETSP0816-20121228/5707_1 /TAXON_ID=420281 /ORGANISM="Proboscia inermis, Strain CCAP1064/1" /LENGTH=329 /DNA_ID=CAMNT_0011770877 /DNA_START=15 /DNA_END=1004 /DNA_ORIENTATION=+
MGQQPSKIQTKYYHDFVDKLPSLKGKTVAVTGCTTGTGNIVARTFIKKGASNVLLLNRPSERATKVYEELSAEAASDETKVEAIDCDLQDFESVRKAAESIKEKYDSLDILCNNAGIMAQEDKATKDGYDIQMQTNHHSHFLLTKELYPLLQKANELRGEARVANHSSGARNGASKLQQEYFGMNGGNLGGNGDSMFFGGGRWVRYRQSKLANCVFTQALKDRFADSGIKAVVATPGGSVTNLQSNTGTTGGMQGNMWILRFCQTAEDGAMPILAACMDPSTENGDFWDPSGTLTGPAVKISWSKSCLDPDNKKNIWEWSEEACGKFEI